ncbi:MAG: hypothetical protein AAF389_20630 [Gemmatimonadota bacterium]
MNRDGVLLLEALIGLAVLSIVGISALTHVTAVRAAYERAAEREIVVHDAEQLLAEYVLMDRIALGQRLGVREVDGFVVFLDRPEPSLFRIGLAGADRPEVEVLTTLLYRPEPRPEGIVR